MRGEILLAAGRHQGRPVEWRKVQFAFRTYNAKLVSSDIRIPAHVDDAMNSLSILDEHSGGVFYGDFMHGIGQTGAHVLRRAKNVVQQIDAMRADVIKRSAAGF